jgi:hypothetical protein
MSDNVSDGTPLDSRVLKWLEEQGYSLEMRTAQVFRQVGFEVSQFETYIDPESGDIREIDVTASKSCHLDTIDVMITLFIECKHMTHPWVIFTSSRRSNPLAYFSRILRGQYDLREWASLDSFQGCLLARILLSLGQQELSRYRFFNVPQNIGYGITESLKSYKAVSKAFTAMMQVSKCLEAHDARTEMIFQRTIRDYETRAGGGGFQKAEASLFCRIAFPVVVVRGKLFECYLDTDNNMTIAEIDEGTVLVAHRDRGERQKETCASAVRIVTTSHLESLAQEAHQAFVTLLSQEAAVEEVWKHMCAGIPETEEIPF